MTPFHFTDGEPSAPGTRRIDVPAHLATKAELLDFLAKAFPLPAYFGHNWDALEECLLDLDWLKSPVATLSHQDIPLEKNPTDQRTYLRILAKAASPRLRVEFPPASRAAIEKLLAE
jgi:RNAse (barnase) inhibitor barstar